MIFGKQNLILIAKKRYIQRFPPFRPKTVHDARRLFFERFRIERSKTGSDEFISFKKQ